MFKPLFFIGGRNMDGVIKNFTQGVTIKGLLLHFSRLKMETVSEGSPKNNGLHLLIQKKRMMRVQ